jgi:hypothetical protein
MCRSFGQISAVWSNQKRAVWVSTCPLNGIAARMRSKAEILSDEIRMRRAGALDVAGRS